MLSNKAHRRCFGEVSQRAVLNTELVGEEKDIALTRTEMLEELDTGEDQKAMHTSVVNSR
jgi:hypothetical protein